MEWNVGHTVLWPLLRPINYSTLNGLDSLPQCHSASGFNCGFFGLVGALGIIGYLITEVCTNLATCLNQNYEAGSAANVDISDSFSPISSDFSPHLCLWRKGWWVCYPSPALASLSIHSNHWMCDNAIPSALSALGATLTQIGLSTEILWNSPSCLDVLMKAMLKQAIRSSYVCSHSTTKQGGWDLLQFLLEKIDYE